MTKLKVRDKQICLFSIIFEVESRVAGINFEKLLGWKVFNNPNFNPFQSSSVLPIRGICCVILSFL